MKSIFSVIILVAIVLGHFMPQCNSEDSLLPILTVQNSYSYFEGTNLRGPGPSKEDLLHIIQSSNIETVVRLNGYFT